MRGIRNGIVGQVDEEQLLEVCGEDPGWVCERALETWGNEFAAKALDFLLARPLKVALILFGAYVLNRVVRRGIKRFVADLQGEKLRSTLGRARKRAPMGLLAVTSEGPSTRTHQRAETIGVVLRSVASTVIYVMAFLIALGELGIQLGPLIAGAGIVGVALGFGAQSVVKDFLAGIFMLIEDQYGVGDVVDVGEAGGVVEAVSLRVTRLRDVYGTVWHVPNGEIRRVGNKSQNWARALVDVDVAYDTDLDRARSTILAVAEEMAADEDWRARFLEAPEVWGVENLGADGISIRVVAKVVPLEQWEVQRELRRRIKARFDADGIEIPFPQRTIWVRNDGEGGSGLTGEPRAPRRKRAARKS